ncbi:MAG: hypothetical protein ACI88S_002078, partial [Ilumatobacter sp.]
FVEVGDVEGELQAHEGSLSRERRCHRIDDDRYAINISINVNTKWWRPRNGDQN